MPIHQAVIWISDDDLVGHCVELWRHPFTLGRGFDQNPGVWTSPEECGQSITRRANALIDHLPAHRQKGYIYLAMGFSEFVERVNLRIRGPAVKPVHLHQPYGDV
jgi:hypothetical protein